MKHFVKKLQVFGFARAVVVFFSHDVFSLLRSFLYKYLYVWEEFGNGVKIFGGVEMDNPHVRIGNNVTISKNVRFGGKGKIRIGNSTGIGAYTCLEAIKEINIGKNCQIARFCYFIDHDHYFKNSKVSLIQQTNLKNDLSTSRPISIGENSWIGANVTILKGVTLGDNCIVGAGSLVTKSFPAGSIIAGVPARKLSQR